MHDATITLRVLPPLRPSLLTPTLCRCAAGENGLSMARTNTRRQHTQRKEFRAECEANDEPCWICGLDIDYNAAWDDWANDDRFQEDHYWPVSTHPHLQEDPENKRPSHAGCNRERGNGAPIVDLGILSREWA